MEVVRLFVSSSLAPSQHIPRVWGQEGQSPPWRRGAFLDVCPQTDVLLLQLAEAKFGLLGSTLPGWMVLVLQRGPLSLRLYKGSPKIPHKHPGLSRYGSQIITSQIG